MTKDGANIKFPIKVLVVEDDTPSRIYVATLLNSIIEKVINADNGQRGLDLFDSERPDLVVTDIGMPEMDGIEMSKKIKNICPNVPIIITTAFDNKSVLIDAIEIGITNYIVKPINKQNILDVVSKVAKSIVLENAYSKQQEYVKTLYMAIEQSSGMVCVFDKDGTISYVNPSFIKVSRLEYIEIIGKNYKMFFGESFDLHSDLNDAVQNAQDWHGEFKLKNKEGAEVYIYASLSRIFDDSGGLKSFVLVADDITQKKLSEQQLQKAYESLEEKVRDRTKELNEINEQLLGEIDTRKNTEAALIKARDEAETANKAKNLFLAKVSHELRTPMNGILGMTSILLDTHIDEKQRRSLSIVKYSGESLLSIINDILDWSKIETGKLSLDEHPFKLREVLNQTYDLLYSISASKGIEFRLHINNDVPDKLFGDSNKLHQVLVNLIGNAIKFTENGLIELATSNLSQKGDSIDLEFTVRDTGIGIPKDKTDELFKSFSQIDNNLTRKYGGNGLGLAISKEIVEKMGGTIHCDSTLGVGSVFHFSAKFQIDNSIENNNVSGSKSIAKNAIELPQCSLKLLIAEDSAINRGVIQEVLSKQDCEFEFVQNGLDAYEIFQNDEFDIILMDLQMPVWDGLKASKAIIEFEKENNWKHTPIIAFTAHNDEEMKNKCKDIGIDDFLTKPININDLYSILAKYQKLLEELDENNDNTNKPADFDFLLETINSNQVLLYKLIQYFINNVPDELKKLDKAIIGKDFDNIMRIAHKLKSEVGNFKALKTVEILNIIENNGKSKEINNIFEAYTSLKQEIKILFNYFQEYLDKSTKIK